MKLLKKIIFFSLCLFLTTKIFAQDSLNNTNTDFMNSNGKIYVVMTVVVVIVSGLFIYLFSIDRKISKLEKKEK
ncbi:MAG TPA: CcmD family protein [Parafilimonas sp.]|nr:CcmD family protein [Parafilimonas sp.]